MKISISLFGKGVLKLHRAATLQPRKIEHSGFSLLDLTDKFEFTDWSEVKRRFGSGEIAIFQQGGPKGPPFPYLKGLKICFRYQQLN